MNGLPLTKLPRLVWIALCMVLAGAIFYPVSNQFTRGLVAGLLIAVWVGAIALAWPSHRRRWTMLGLTVAMIGFVLLPARALPDRAMLREEYVSGLKRYQGVRYIWGGESFTGIDCSGLIRRGLIDALALRGVRTLDAGLVRRAFSLWVHDCSASALGNNYRQLTTPVLDAADLHHLDYARILPGDLAVTATGVHIMAYTGNQTWLEADPVKGKVIALPLSNRESPWLDCKMHVVRWSVLAP